MTNYKTILYVILMFVPWFLFNLIRQPALCNNSQNCLTFQTGLSDLVNYFILLLILLMVGHFLSKSTINPLKIIGKFMNYIVPLIYLTYVAFSYIKVSNSALEINKLFLPSTNLNYSNISCIKSSGYQTASYRRWSKFYVVTTEKKEYEITTNLIFNSDAVYKYLQEKLNLKSC